MPTARSAACWVTVGTSIYVIGGRTGDRRPLDDDIDIVEQYDTHANVWAGAPCLNRPRAYCSALLVGNYIFVLGGSTRLTLKSLDLNNPMAWQDFPTKMPITRNSSCVSVAVGRNMCLVGGTGMAPTLQGLGAYWIWTAVFGLNCHHFRWITTSQACTLDGSIYLFGASKTGGVNKYDIATNRWLTLPRCKEGRDGCYLAFLVWQPLHSLSIFPFQKDDQQPSHLQAHAPVIQYVQHPDEAAAVDPAEAAAIVAEQWAQQAELNLGAFSTSLQPPGQLFRLILLAFTRHPVEFQTALLEGPELQSCREQMQGLPCRLDSGTFVFLEPFQYHVAIDAAMRQQVRLTVHHVITSERFEPSIMQAVHGLRSRLNVRLRGKQTILEPLEVKVSRTFLNVPDRSLRSIASVTHSTTDVHGGRNHRTVCR